MTSGDFMDKNNLEKRIAELERQMQALNQSNTIPFDVEYALMGRGFIKTAPPEEPTAAVTADARYLRVLNMGGVDYFIRLYVFS